MSIAGVLVSLACLGFCGFCVLGFWMLIED